MGFQIIHVLECPKPDVLLSGYFNSSNLPSTMHWNLNPKNFSLYSYFDDTTLNLFETQKVTFENHKDGILAETYDKY